MQFCSSPKGILEIADMLKYKDKKTVRKYLNPLVEQGRIAMTIHDRLWTLGLYSGGQGFLVIIKMKRKQKMKRKPIVMERFYTVHTSYIVNLEFTNNIIILTGSAASGKSMVFSFIKECMTINKDILCLNYLDYQKNIKELISQAKGKLIVIDNADILFDDDTRKYISLDGENQYLIIGRNPKNLFATKENLFELVSKQVGEQVEFQIVGYL